MPAIALNNPIIKVGGSELSRAMLDALVEARIELELRLPGRVKLRFQDPNGELARSGHFDLGKSVSLTVPRGGGTLIDAEITGLGYEASTGSVAHERFDGRTAQINELVVVGHDRAYRLTRSSAVKGLMAVKSSDVVAQIASAWGLTPDVHATSRVFDYAARVHTDIDLLNALADREGYDWWVGPSDTLHFTPIATTSVTTLKLGEHLHGFSVQASALLPDKVSVRGWQQTPTAQPLTAEAEAQSSPVWPTGVSLLSKFKTPGSSVHAGASTMVVSRTGAASDADATSIANSLRDRAVSSAVTARGEGEGNAAIAVGRSVTIEGAGPADGIYHVTRVEHVVNRSSFRTRFVAGDRRRASLVDMLAGSREQPRFPVQRDALVVGTVTALGKPAENKGLVKVKFPGLDNDTFTSAWARFLSVGAGGTGRGLVMLPEIGDQVLVGFEDSDLHRPVVLGGLYQADSNVGDWDVDNGNVMSRRITSRTGHVIEMKDGIDDATKHVQISVAGDKGKVLLRVGADKVEVTAPDGVPINLTTGQAKVQMKADGSIAVEATKIEMKGTTELSLAAPKISIKADQDLELQGMQTTLSGSLKTDVKAGGPLSIKGAQVAIN